MLQQQPNQLIWLHQLCNRHRSVRHWLHVANHDTVHVCSMFFGMWSFKLHNIVFNVKVMYTCGKLLRPPKYVFVLSTIFCVSESTWSWYLPPIVLLPISLVACVCVRVPFLRRSLSPTDGASDASTSSGTQASLVVVAILSAVVCVGLGVGLACLRKRSADRQRRQSV